MPAFATKSSLSRLEFKYAYMYVLHLNFSGKQAQRESKSKKRKIKTKLPGILQPDDGRRTNADVIGEAAICNLHIKVVACRNYS